MTRGSLAVDGAAMIADCAPDVLAKVPDLARRPFASRRGTVRHRREPSAPAACPAPGGAASETAAQIVSAPRISY
jgi:hypothetical protein